MRIDNITIDTVNVNITVHTTPAYRLATPIENLLTEFDTAGRIAVDFPSGVSCIEEFEDGKKERLIGKLVFDAVGERVRIVPLTDGTADDMCTLCAISEDALAEGTFVPGSSDEVWVTVTDSDH